MNEGARSRLIPAVGTIPEESQRMALNFEIGPFSNIPNEFYRDADIDVHHTMTLDAGKMMMMSVATHSIRMSPVREFDSVQ